MLPRWETTRTLQGGHGTRTPPHAGFVGTARISSSPPETPQHDREEVWSFQVWSQVRPSAIEAMPPGLHFIQSDDLRIYTGIARTKLTVGRRSGAALGHCIGDIGAPPLRLTPPQGKPLLNGT
jgi:hypothetical protein